MIVEINNRKFRVYWKHVHPILIEPVNIVPKKNPIPFVKFYGSTSCIIEHLETKEPFSIRIATCSKKDNFNKQKGRIVSLTKAIRHLPKDVRRLFFSQYKKEIGFK